MVVISIIINVSKRLSANHWTLYVYADHIPIENNTELSIRRVAGLMLMSHLSPPAYRSFSFSCLCREWVLGLITWEKHSQPFHMAVPCLQDVEKQWVRKIRAVNIFDNLFFKDFRSAKDLGLFTENFKDSQGLPKSS